MEEPWKEGGGAGVGTGSSAGERETYYMCDIDICSNHNDDNMYYLHTDKAALWAIGSLDIVFVGLIGR